MDKMIRFLLFLVLLIAAVAYGASQADPAKAGLFDGPPAAKDRVIEVVDKIGPKRWNVRKAVNWLDRYTGSDMRLVKRCSGKAYGCITLRTGKVKGPVGWQQGSTITVDDRKAMTTYRKYYRKAGNRHWLLVHELAHWFGEEHRAGRNVMNPAVNRYALTFTSGQAARLRNR